MNRYNIENNYINKILENFELLSSYGKSVFRNLKAYKKEEEDLLNQELSRLGQIINIINDTKNKKDIMIITNIISSLKDLTKIIRQIHNHHILDIVSLYEIKIQAIQISDLAKYLNPLINDSYIKIIDENKLVTLLSDENVSYDFYLYDHYSPKLKSIRSEKAKVELKIKNSISKEEKASLLKERNNIVIEEEKENNEICKQLTIEIRQYLTILEENIQKIGYLDFIIAKAKFSIKHHLVRPTITKGPIIIEEMIEPITGLFNPILIASSLAAPKPSSSALTGKVKLT